ncbi:3'-5' exonuclease [Vibrio vulnificus]|uniref:3'-5' exonuclease n=1 Tax=Vibrio vulnificus TaxID=672 RepID=UPI0019D48E84|nr:3'-5' exonuclease [Vibrio vulnificus]EGR7952880.1 exonuclease domain-containing protein [Vibrio vulnificus]EJY4611622.1 exonuclease domain-containing protein [Vibrio vulnificus]ELV8730189.1 exonuclease domain-containing protein [Vibrio vulnificus]MBN8102591.1 exonuclease domain-containing protein [Vibrio vulnificus]MCA0775523.1 exonuclease domain-containing protein [Vibrio vulnificus]
MNHNRIVCFDLEMCCWNEDGVGRTGEIIEIGLAEIDLLKGEIVKSAQYYVKPEHDEVSLFCAELTGITPRKIEKQGRPLAEVIKSMIKNFGGSNKIYASWGRDDRILMQECQEKGIDAPFNEFINIATLYRIQHRLKDKRIGHRAAQEAKGIEWEGRQHSGYVDAYNLAKLALTMF